MKSITIKTRIQAPPAKVFALATDLRNAAGRIKAIQKLEVLTEGPIARGTRFRETRVMFGRPATEEMTITEFEPPARYALGAESCGCRYRTEFRFTPESGGTEVEMSFAAQPLTFFAKAMSLLMRPLLKSLTKACARDLNDLKVVAEAPS
jgi:carbon monoxide dehydrogenase subunit G